MARLTKKDIYKKHGIEFKNGKILSPIGWIAELLKDGNTKTGKNVLTFSLLPGNGEFTVEINSEEITIKGTCCCNCTGCYAQTGRYNCDNVIYSMAINTYLVNTDIAFVWAAISAQLECMGKGEVRIHAAGDFNTADPDTE